ncbi:mitochondrial resolvase Ydc2 [Nemania serpens]|nr:mitochondrial resolvase Ydc2 [Nemania serpens]
MAAARNLALPVVIPPSLRVEQLKRLSFLCGLPLSGRKDDFIARLTAAAAVTVATPASPKPRPGPVVLSIDLGLRNLAFSLLSPVTSSSSSSSTPSRKKADAKSTNKKKEEEELATEEATPPSSPYAGPPVINLHLWQRLSLLDPLSNSSGQEGSSSDSRSNGDEEDNVPDIDVDVAADAFSPASLAKAANTFLQDTVLRLEPLPTHVLIERQRWRSGGAAAIQEWTVRVNTLEAMLHASLQTLRDVGAWKGEVVSVWPQRVGQLFLNAPDLASEDALRAKSLGEEDGSGAAAGGKRRSIRKSSSEIKKLKIELLRHWLGQGGLVIRPDNLQARRMVNAYRETLEGVGRRRSKRAAREELEEDGKGPALGRKLDDLTDSLMQGMAWLRWQENMALLRRDGGVEKLLELDAA